LRTRKIVGHISTAPLNDFVYTLTEIGLSRAREMLRDSGYVGPAPVRLSEYVLSVEAQSISHETPDRARLTTACAAISVDPKMFESLGPAINASGGMFLYGAPGNGKSTLARHITMCFGQHIWVPQTIIAAGQIIKLYDSEFHRQVDESEFGPLLTSNVDRRWVQIQRPTVVVGGELTLDSLELRHHRSRTCARRLCR